MFDELKKLLEAQDQQRNEERKEVSDLMHGLLKLHGCSLKAYDALTELADRDREMTSHVTFLASLSKDKFDEMMTQLFSIGKVLPHSQQQMYVAICASWIIRAGDQLLTDFKLKDDQQQTTEKTEEVKK